MKLIQKIKDFLKKRRNISWGRDILRHTKSYLIIWCVLFLGGVTNAQDTVTVSCIQTCTVQGDIIQQIRSRLDSLNPTLQCIDAERVESQIIELVKKIHKAEKLTCEVPKPETIIIETPIYRDPIPQPTQIWTTWVPEKVTVKKKRWK